MVVLAKGDFIWIKPTSRGEFTVPVGARVLEVKNGSYLIQDDDGNSFTIDADTECHLMHPSSIKSMPDMIALGELTECGILRNLYLRYQENQIYTYTGSILIAINPYRPLPIYSLDTMKEYSNKAFGNAKTVRNDNSSRFGKYVDVHFDQNSGRIVSARIEQYLLEKSRIVTQAPGERNYHAFYCMLAGMKAERKNQLGLKDVSAYNYLVQNENVCDNKNDANHFETIVSTMKYLKFRDKQIDDIWNLLAAILHLGNISFCETLKESADASKIVDSNRAELRYASSLLGMSPGCLERALTTKRLLTAGECVVAQILPATAHTVRDAFAKTIYDQLFRWIVEKINAAIYRPLEGAKPKTSAQTPSSRQSTSRPVSLNRVSDDRRSASLLGSRGTQKTITSDSDAHWAPRNRSRSKAADTAERKDVDSSGTMTTSTVVSSAGPGRVSIGVLDIFGFENFSKNRRWLAVRGSSILAKRKKYVHADSVIQQNHNVKLDTCDSILSVDTPLNRAGNACIRTCPLLEGTLRITRVVKAVPEEFNSSQCVSSLDESIGGRPTQIAKVYASTDFDNLVDEIFGGIFDSVHEDKMARTLPFASPVTVTVKRGDRPAVHIHDYGHRICQLADNSRVKAQFSMVSQKITDSLPSELVSEGDHTFNVQTSTEESSVASQPPMNECSFLKFAAAYFQTGSTPLYTTSRLVRPLLKHRNQCDLLLALDIFSRIQAFMKPQMRDKERVLGKQALHSKPESSRQKKHRTPLPNGDEDTLGEHQRPSSSLPNLQRRKRAASSIDGCPGGLSPSIAFTQAQNAPAAAAVAAASSEGNLLSDLQIARFIVKAGIEHPLLRDEIYCQIIKQITKNPCDLSRRKGWVLLSLCSSCFPPTHFEAPLREYLKANPSSFSRACIKRLHRLHQTGTRSRPPSYMELRAAEENKSLVINIHCADNSQVKVKVDPAVTVAELSTNAFKAIGLKDTFGFEIFINIFEKSYSLSSGPKHLFDTISFCEQHARSKGLEESELPWSFSIRKTIFAPWHDVRYDPIATALICYQVCQQCFTEAHESLEEHELAFLLASMFRLFHSDVQGNCQLDSLGDSADINSWLAEILSADCDLKYWQKVVGTALCELQNRYPSPTIEGMRQTIVTFAKLQWAEIFTREFEVKVLVDDTTSYDAILGLESNGVQLYDESGKHLTVLNLVEIHSVCVNPLRLRWLVSPLVDGCLSSIDSSLFDRPVTATGTVVSPIAGGWLSSLDSSLFDRPVTVTGTVVGDRKSAHLRPGDFLVLDCLGWELDPSVEPVGVPRPPASESAVQEGFCCGENQRTRQTGWFPVSHIYVLPTLGVPNPELINAFSQLIISAENQDWLNNSGFLGDKLRNRSTPKLHRPLSVTKSFFRNNSRSLIDASGGHDRLSVPHILDHETARRSTTPSTPTAPLNTLQHTRLPLKFPFVNEVALANRKVYEAAVLAFCIIQVYMGDCEKVPLPLKDVPAIVLTDLLFGSALNCPLLRDELFMQLMNQLTKNPNRQSEDRGWELLWLASGVMIPSDRLLNKLICFLHRSSHTMAPQCYIRLHHTKSRGNRKKPPHPMELTAVRERKSKFSQKVVLPDGECLVVFLQSDTRGSDVVDEICLELGVGSKNDFAVYVELDGEKRCIEDEDFVLDCLHLTLPDMWHKSKRPLLAPPPAPLYFKRKLWLQSVPGMGSVSDNVIDSHQELENFLQGYHRCSFEQFLELSTLIYIWRGQKVSAERLLPRTMLSHIYEPDWIERLANVANQGPQLSSSDAPLAFLKSLATVPTFGSAFFDVQSAEVEEEWILAVNKEKILVWPRNRELKPLEYPLRDILKCWYEHHILNFRLRTSDTLHQWVCTDVTAFNSANLIRSYMQRHIMQLPNKLFITSCGSFVNNCPSTPALVAKC
nr:unnamed protein product [Spirometra erinaceieuropaei]